MTTQKRKGPNFDDMINQWHDPDVLHAYIKNVYNESKKGIINNDLTEEQRVSTSILYRLEVFRASMQYLEEFGLYFISYTESPDNIAKKLVKTAPKDVNNLFKQFKQNNHDNFSQDIKSKNYRELLKEVFAYDIIPQLTLNNNNEILAKDVPTYIEESIDYIKENIDNFAEFYLRYIDLYNSIKHGTRVFPHKLKYFELKGQKNIKINLEEDYITAICKRSDGEVYSLEYPVNLLMEQSMSVSNYINKIFSYLRKIIKYKLSNPGKIKLTFFKSIPNSNKEEYIKVSNAESVMIMPKHPELEDFVGNPLVGTKAFNIIKKGKTIFLHTKFDETISPDYPVLITLKGKLSDELEPKYRLTTIFNFDILNMDVKQYLDLIEMHGLSEDEVDGIIIFDDLNNRAAGSKLKPDNFDLPKIELIHDKSIIKFLIKLQKITQKRIPTPLDLSQGHKLVISHKINEKISNREEANEIIAKLKDQSNKVRYTVFNIKKIDLNGNIICSDELGTLHGTWINFNFEDSQTEQKFKEIIYENPKGHLRHVIEGIDADPNDIIKEFNLFVKDPINNDYPKIVTNDKIINNPKFDLIFDYKFGKPEFWYQNHIVNILIKIIK